MHLIRKYLYIVAWSSFTYPMKNHFAICFNFAKSKLAWTLASLTVFPSLVATRTCIFGYPFLLFVNTFQASYYWHHRWQHFSYWKMEVGAAGVGRCVPVQLECLGMKLTIGPQIPHQQHATLENMPMEKQSQTPQKTVKGAFNNCHMA